MRRQVSPASFAICANALPMASNCCEVGALEAVDRLLLVADDEQRAHLAARAGVAEELRRQRLDDLPLLGARVLRLVDEDVVDAAVELEHHPRRELLPAEQEDALGNQILVVERGAARLGERVALQHRAREPMQGDRRVDGAQAATLLDEADEAHLRRATARRRDRHARRRCLWSSGSCAPCRRCRRSLPARRHARRSTARRGRRPLFAPIFRSIGRAAAQCVAHARQLARRR